MLTPASDGRGGLGGGGTTSDMSLKKLKKSFKKNCYGNYNNADNMF